MAVVNTLYDVGGRDESPDHTGLAHLFEHLMFGGSVNIPDFDAPLQAAGGSSNAWTSNDFTCFHDVIPAHNIETALWLESDRMLSLAFSDKALEVQRSVVVEEFKEVCLNRPYGDMGHLLFGMAYPDHPYGVPVIGRDFHDIEKTTQEDVRPAVKSPHASSLIPPSLRRPALSRPQAMSPRPPSPSPTRWEATSRRDMSPPT